MNYHVPDFGAEEQGEDPFLPFRDRGGLTCGDELAEVLWRKGPVLRRFERPEEPPAFPRDAPGIPEEPRDLFMAEDELASWLYQPADEAETAGTGGAIQSPEQTRPALDPPAPPPALDSRESIAVGSSSTPALQRRVQPAPVTRDDRKRKKAWNPELSDDDEAAEQESFDRREGRRPAGRKSRAAEVHNLSERRRRDRINEKMKALQQLIPRCNKTDKASMLDDAVEYLKSLQLQVQMMSMGCAMPAMMFPGMTQYLQMLMGMGSDANAGYLPCPMLPFPPAMQPPPISAASATHMGGGIPMPAFCPAPMYINQQSTGRQTGQPSDSVSSITPMPTQGQSAPQVMNVARHHLQYLSPQQMQQTHENQTEKLEQGS